MHMEIRKVMRYNKSLMFCIPPQHADALRIQRGDYVAITLDASGYLRVGRVDPEKFPDLFLADPSVIDYGKKGK